MLTSSGYGAISPVSPAKVYRTNKERENRTKITASPNNFENYDSVTLSSAPTRESRFHMDLVGRMSQSVRTATTTGDIQSLRQQVASGQYTPDPMAIAARILFLGEGS